MTPAADHLQDESPARACSSELPFNVMIGGLYLSFTGVVVSTFGIIVAVAGGENPPVGAAPLIYLGIGLCIVGTGLFLPSSIWYSRERERWRQAMMDEIRARIQRMEAR